MNTFIKAATKLIDCVEFDMNGAGGKGGNGGLLSDTTLRAAHDLRVIMSREAEREQKARPQRPDPHAFPIFDCPQLPAPSVAMKALEPFAKEADRWEPRGEAHWLDSTPFPANSISTLNIGHLRAARSALSAQVQDVAGWQPTLPTYHRYPYFVESIFGKWHLRFHHGNGASHTISKHETAAEAIAAAPTTQEG